MKTKILVAAIALALLSPARADYVIKDGAGATKTIKAGTLGGGILPWSNLVDSFGAPTGTSANPLYVAFPSSQHVVCDSGCSGGSGGTSYTVTYGSPIGTLGTPAGYRDASGNFQPIAGDASGQFVNVKASVAIPVTGSFFQTVQPVSIASSVPVTGTFFQSVQPISASALPLPVGAATQATLASILSNLGTPMQAGGSIANTSFGIAGTLPAFAATPTFNLGTLNGAATATLQSAGNASVASIDGKTPALGQALATGSVPVVLPAAQITALTPPASVGLTGTLPAFAATPTFNVGTIAGIATSAQQTSGAQKTQIVDGAGNVIGATANALNVQCIAGCSGGSGGGGTSSTYGAAFPTTGTAVGMTQGGNMVALSGTSGNLNVQCANCSGSGVSTADGAAFTAGSSLFAGAGGIFQTTATSNPVASGQQGLFQMTANRALFTNLRNASGVEVATAAAPIRVDPTGTTTQPVSGSVAITGGSISNTSFAATQATAANLNATVVGTGTFAVQSAQSGAYNITNVTGTVSLPTGAATSALQATGNTSLSSLDTKTPALGQALAAASTPVVLPATQITALTPPTTVTANLGTIAGAATQTTLAAVQTALGSPFQAGGSIGNTAFGISGTVPAPTTASTWGLIAQGATASGAVGQIALGVVSTSAPTYTAGQAMPMSFDASGNLRVTGVGGGGGGGTALADGAAFTQGTTSDTPFGCLYATTVTNLTAGQQGVARCTTDRQVLVQDAALLAAANAAIPAGTNTIGTTGSLPYPIGAVPLTASATGTTAATTATLAGATGKTTYVCGYSIRANATANANVTNTLTGVISGTMSSAMWVPANTAGLGVDEQLFTPCIPASAANTAIAAVSGAPGTGGVVTVKAWGFQL